MLTRNGKGRGQSRRPCAGGGRRIDLAQGALSFRPARSDHCKPDKTQESNMTLDTRETLDDLFPHDHEVLHALKLHNAHFRTLAERHHLLTRQIYRIETDIEPACDEHLEDLKKERLAILDDMSNLIAQQRS
ncbi:YdcH family protein [Sphingobium sp. B10D7B]|uniref:YdcH family protein n=2 Tax=Sphingomonadaceae TaxID=41297 RepID=UPI0022253F75|nr:DUF465 domain-containing protein [Sphingobium sp. B10D7B]